MGLPRTALLLLLGCASTPTGPGRVIQGSIRGDACHRAGKRIAALDLDRDGRPDVRRLFAKREGGLGEYLSCREVDLNRDGRDDLFTHFDASGARILEEMDLDFDGRVDVVSFLSDGRMVRQELDTDFDGRPDVTRYFENDKLARVERDANHDGRVDQREFYEGGVLDRIGFDDDGDGNIDRWERTPPAAGDAEAGGAAEAEPQLPSRP